MKTYVEYQGKKFDTISDAIEYAEVIEAETAKIDVYDNNGNYLEGQIAERNPHGLVFTTWSVSLANISVDHYYWIEINSQKEAYEIAHNLKSQNPSDSIYIHRYRQTLECCIECVDNREYI